MSIYKKLPFIVIIIVIVGATFFVSKGKLIQQAGSGNTHTIALTEDGYQPEKITVKKGDTIIFMTRIDKPHWPASDLHPTHELYPGFDPEEPVDKEKTWSFTFTKEGQWKYHDHLSPYYRGVIIVNND
jgi:plastocyanin